MRKLLLLLAILTVTLLPATPAALALDHPQQSSQVRDPEGEGEILTRLAQISPDAVPIFRQATEDMDAERYEAAMAGFEKVLSLAPLFPDALRRLSSVELELGYTTLAVQHSRSAYEAARHPWNAAALARALLALGDARSNGEALELAREAATAEPDDAPTQFVLVLAAAANEDRAVFKQSVERLLELTPDEPASHYFAGVLAMVEGKWTRARAEFTRAGELGLPEELYAEQLAEADAHIRSQATQLVWLKRLGYIIAGWFGVLGLLFLAGLILSRITLAAVRRAPAGGEFRIGPLERIVRNLYAGVIALTSAFFYVSLPLLTAVILLGTAGLIYVQLRASRISLYLLAMTALVGFYTVLAIVLSIFTRVKESEPGRLLTEVEAPGLWALAREIAGRTGTRPVDAVYLTPGVEVAVTERGRLLQKLRGAGQRYLIVGLGSLPGMTEREFAAILAHEYGHFSNRDTAGGNIAHQVNLSMHAMAYRLASRGLARWYNPAWWFINGFSKVFFRITLGASRLQEILADRYAALAYGAQDLIDGLTRIIRQDLAFDLMVDRSARRALAQGRDLPNLYAAPASASVDAATLEKQFDEIMARPTAPYDSHPAVSERIRLVQDLPSASVGRGSDRPASELFADLPALQAEMTRFVQGKLVANEKGANAVRAAEYRQSAQESVPEIAPFYEALADTVERGDGGGEAEAWDNLAEAYEERGLPARAANCYGTAAICYQDLEDQEGERVARYNRAEALKTLEEWREAEDELVRVVALDEVTDSPELESDRAELEAVRTRAAEQAETAKSHRRK